MVRRFAVLALVLAGCGGHDKVGGRRSAHVQTVVVALRDGTTRYLDAYAAAARPALTVRPRTRWRENDPRSEVHTIADVRAGRIDFALVAARAFDRVGVDAFAPALAPFAITSLESERRLLAAAWPARALAAVSRLGVEGVAVLPGDLRYAAGLTRPLVRPEDFKGARMGIRESALTERTFAALGARSGLLADGFDGYDGTEADLPAIESNRLQAQVAFNLVLWPRLMVLIANPRAWRALTPGQRAALRRSARASLPAAIASLRRTQRESYGVLCRRGDVSIVVATPGEVSALRTALAPLARADLAWARAGAEPVPGPCERPAAPAAGRAAIDGVWTFDSNEADLLATGAAIDDTPENWGHHVLVFDRGRFAVTQENGQSCTWVYGTFAVDGDHMIWDVIDGGGGGPNNATNRPGEHFEYLWSRFRDTLRATVAPGASSAVNFIARPWRRLGDDPARAPLSDRCPPPSR